MQWIILNLDTIITSQKSLMTLKQQLKPIGQSLKLLYS